MGLSRYRSKRNFDQSPEPKGRAVRSRAASTTVRSFVVQKHDATRLHYDFRLEMEGVLKSWAVPKGFPWKRGEKRLAMRTEDHPMEYGGFEGTIPKGHYGGGTVMLWDRGEYEVIEGTPASGLKKGSLLLRLKGSKLKGDWRLIRTKGGDHEKEAWLLLKSGADVPPVSAKREDQSVSTRRGMKAIAKEADRIWDSGKETGSKPRGKGEQWPKKKASKPASQPKRTRPGSKDSIATLPPGMPKRAAQFLEPMKARLIEEVPKGKPGDWLYEIKWDGYRILAVKKGSKVALFTRAGRTVTADYPHVASAIEALELDEAILDGELVALDRSGKPSFQLMQNYRGSRESGREEALVFYVFDLVQLQGRDLCGLPLTKRRALLQKILSDATDPLRFSGSLDGDPESLLALIRAQQLEGLIGKKSGSLYEPGGRSGAWIKLKVVNDHDFVIGGMTPPSGGRQKFGALLVGTYHHGELHFASRVGSGFTEDLLKSTHAELTARRIDRCPFVNLPRGGRGGVSRSEMRSITWVRPELVCSVRFSEWTADGGLRHPVFHGLVEDKDPAGVVKENA